MDDDDYAVLRKYGGRSSFAAYLSVVIQRLLIDQRIHAHGLAAGAGVGGCGDAGPGCSNSTYP